MLNDTFIYTHNAGISGSSFATEVWYNEHNHVLVIGTHSGSQIAYEGVPKDIYESLVESDSQGTFYSRMIKGIYNYIRDTDYTFFIVEDSPAEEQDDVLPLPVVSTVGSAGGKYAVIAYYDNLEDAVVAFSYADGVANYASMSIDRDE